MVEQGRRLRVWPRAPEALTAIAAIYTVRIRVIRQSMRAVGHKLKKRAHGASERRR